MITTTSSGNSQEVVCGGAAATSEKSSEGAAKTLLIRVNADETTGDGVVAFAGLSMVAPFLLGK